MDPFLRDTRHLAGRKPTTDAPIPQHTGLALGLTHDTDARPRLRVGQNDGTVTHLDFTDALDLLVEQGRHCVGTRTDDQWKPCPDNQEADHFTRCPRCHPLPVRECVFNPRCTDCTQEFCTSPHEVYIAYHGKHPKVGMTRQAREGDRLIEQGADAWSLVATVDDRFQARNLEDRITARLQIPQAVTTKHRFTRFAQRVPQDVIRAHHERLAPQLQELTGTPPGDLIFPPGPKPTLSEVPVPAATVGHHTGRILGAHGRYLFYQSAPQGPIWALDIKDIITHPVRFNE